VLVIDGKLLAGRGASIAGIINHQTGVDIPLQFIDRIENI
jgi:hypothetical protein